MCKRDKYRINVLVVLLLASSHTFTFLCKVSGKFEINDFNYNDGHFILFFYILKVPNSMCAGYCVFLLRLFSQFLFSQVAFLDASLRAKS